jgi:hypothetical protein
MTRPINLQEQTELLVRNGATIIFSKRSWLNRLAVIPFEVCFMLFSFFAGLGGFFHIGTTNTMFNLSIAQADLYNFLLAAAACTVIYGIARRKPNIEAAGLVILAGQLLIRAVVLVPFAVSSINSIVIFLLMTIAILVRLRGVVTKTPHIEIENSQ